VIDKIFSFGTIRDATEGITASIFFVCLIAALVVGFAIALCYMFKNRYTSSIVVALIIIPAAVSLLIMLIRNSIGGGIAVAGTFSLVRFRSAQGSAKEIGFIFLSTACGIAIGAGYIGVALIFCLIMIILSVILTLCGFGNIKSGTRMLRVTIPESIDYTDVFDTVFEKYTSSVELVKVRTTNMGSLFRLTYRLELKDASKEKEFIDEIRVRNGNLDIVCGRDVTDSEYSL